MVYYFGNFKVEGHYLYGPGGIRVRSRTEQRSTKIPWALGELDGGLCPKSKGQNGVAAVHHRDDWSALSFWDRSGDSRPGSNSTFLVDEPNLTFQELFDKALEAFPTIWFRFNFSVVEAEA